MDSKLGERAEYNRAKEFELQSGEVESGKRKMGSMTKSEKQPLCRGAQNETEFDVFFRPSNYINLNFRRCSSLFILLDLLNLP